MPMNFWLTVTDCFENFLFVIYRNIIQLILPFFLQNRLFGRIAVLEMTTHFYHHIDPLRIYIWF